MWLNYVSWSPDSKRIVFTLRSDGQPGSPPRGPLELWTADIDTFTARPLLQAPQYGLNTVFEECVIFGLLTIAVDHALLIDTPLCAACAV